MAAKSSAAKKADPPASGETTVLDVSQTSVKKMIAGAKARGTITYDELNRVLPSDKVSPDQIEDVMAMLSEMGVNVVEEEAAEEEKGEEESKSTEWARLSCCPVKARLRLPSALRPVATR